MHTMVEEYFQVSDESQRELNYWMQVPVTVQLC